MTSGDPINITYSGKAAEAISDRRVQTIIPSLSWMPEMARAAYTAAVELETLQMQAAALCHGGGPSLLILVHEEAARRGQLMESWALHAGGPVPDGRLEGLRSVVDDLRAGRLR